MLEQLVARKVRYMAPHEYYMLHIVPVRGGQSEVPSLIHNGVLMYMRMVTEPRGAPSVRPGWASPSLCAYLRYSFIL